MTRPPSTPPILSELRSPSSPASQVAALRALKNEIIGHEQKKEMWVGLGVVIPIARILNTYKGNGKRKHKDTNGSGDYGSRRRSRTDEEEARLQAIIIVGALAHGGPSYIPPLTAGSIFPPLLAILNPGESHPQLVLAGLRALNSVADSLLLEEPSAEPADGGLLSLLYSDLHLTSLVAVLNQVSPALIVQQQISLVAALIIKTCREETHRTQLAHAGVIEALAGRLASFVIATESSSQAFWGTKNASLTPATTKSRLSPILQAIGTIITKSKSRTKQFICSPIFATIFPRVEINHDSSTNSLSNPHGGHHWYHSIHGHNSPQTLDSPYRDSSAQMSNFPPLGTLGTTRGNIRNTRGYSAALETLSAEGYSGVEGTESPLIAWLVYVVRAETGVTRLMTSWVLTILYRMGCANHRREVGLALLLVPLLVRMLENDSVIPLDKPTSYDASLLQSPEQLIMQHAPSVLSLLVEDHLQLQQAAVDAKAIEKLSLLLKKSYEPLPVNPTSSLWTPYPTEVDKLSSHDSASPSKLGQPGLSPEAYHKMRMRESVLIALAAIATAKDEFRKTIIDSGVVQFIIESLKPYDKALLNTAEASKPMSITIGNPTPVLLAACGAARALSRSVKTLRTSLIDAGLAAPLFILLRHPELDVQVASTAVVCNLLLEFSPMRDTMIEAGILKILCEHAHSMNAKLRLNAMWGLKHLVNTAPNSLKTSCLEELGPGWLKQIISNDTEDTSHPLGLRGDRDISNGVKVAMGMGTPNAAGEQVDLLNAVDEESADSIGHADQDEEDEVNMIDSIGELGSSEDISTVDPLRAFIEGKRTEERKRPASKLDLEIQAGLQARKDDMAVQEQALKFIQNLICGPGASEMIDYLFRELGQDKFFDILATRLQPKIPDLFRRNRKSSENGLRNIPPPTEIIKGVCYIIVHIAAGSPRHKQLLMSQHELLMLLVPLFGHPNKEIRSTCVWLVINLTWADDQSDRLHCKSRAYELRKLGIVDKLNELDTDPELDVRERTKTAKYQLNELLH